jgi:hypothetical protein
MSYSRKSKTEAGQGGKLGHSNMSHCDCTEVIKKQSNKTRRNVAKRLIRKAKESI